MISTSPSSTVIHAFSFTWCSPSDWPGLSTIRTARAPSSEWSTIGSRVPSGASSVEEVPALHREKRIRSPDTLKRCSCRSPSTASCMGPFQIELLRRAERARRGRGGGRSIPAPTRPSCASSSRGIGYARPAGILVTHTDVDHIGGVAALAEGTGRRGLGARGRGRGAAHRGDARRRCASRRTIRRTPSRAATRSRSRASRSRWSTSPATRPGTSRSTRDGELFSGDLLFAGSVGRVDLAGGDWETLLDSVRALLDRFPPETVVYPGPRARDDARPRARDEPVPARAARPSARRDARSSRPRAARTTSCRTTPPGGSSFARWRR